MQTMLEPMLKNKFIEIRQMTKNLCSPLTLEDYVIQTCEDVSPPKWHLAHTTWFFEHFILLPGLRKYKAFNQLYLYLFNSYYNGAGKIYPREKRGLISRPGVDEVLAYRTYVDDHIIEYFDELSTYQGLLNLGLQHEQQHQELLLMDIKFNFAANPAFPAYKSLLKFHYSKAKNPLNMHFLSLEGGLVEIGYKDNTFCFDNELPQHTTFLRPFTVGSRLVTNAEYQEFIDAKGYENPEFWLTDGWAEIHNKNIKHPLYWHQVDNEWYHFTLNGLLKVPSQTPVSHISYYEADAYARFRGMRLPTEQEWEYAANQYVRDYPAANFLENHFYEPLCASEGSLYQFFGDLWEWTSSAYDPYPGFKPYPGVVGEYNGKFMANQKVLRGGSCLTPRDHIRATYRNFFKPEKRWQSCGIRLAKS